MTLSVRNDFLVQPNSSARNEKARRVNTTALPTRAAGGLTHVDTAPPQRFSASRRARGSLTQTLTRAWHAVSAKFAKWREAVSDLFAAHSVGLGIYKKYKTYIPPKQDFDTIFDKAATEQEKIQALDNKMLKLGIVVSVMSDEPLVSQDYDVLNLRRLLFKRMIGPLNTPKDDAQRAIRKMYLMAHTDKVKNMSPAMRLELFGGHLYEAIQHLQSLCNDDTSFATLTNRI